MNSTVTALFGTEQAEHDTTAYTGPTSYYARLPGLDGEIERDTASPGTLDADFEHILVVVGVQAGADEDSNGVIHPASSRCGGGRHWPVAISISLI